MPDHKIIIMNTLRGPSSLTRPVLIRQLFESGQGSGYESRQKPAGGMKQLASQVTKRDGSRFEKLRLDELQR